MIFLLLVIYGTVVVLSEGTGIKRRSGETVTLDGSKTLHTYKDYLWTYGRPDPVTAITIVTKGELTQVNGTRFESRLQTRIETGSITISNLTANDSGVFLVQFFTDTGILSNKFNLSVDHNGVILLSVLEGNNVTLDSGIEELQKDHLVRWTRGPDFVGDLLAQWKNFAIFINESFVGVLQLDPHTGSLNIIRVTQKYTGFYCVKMLLWGDPHILRQHQITVFEPVPKPYVSHSLNDEKCYINCSVKNGPNVTLHWYIGEKEINQTRNKDISINLTLSLEIQNQNEGIYTCVVTNPASKAVDTLSSTQWCPPHGPEMMTWIVVGLIIIIIILIILGLVIFFCKRQNNKRQKMDEACDCMSMIQMAGEKTSQNIEVTEDNREPNEQQNLLPNS